MNINKRLLKYTISLCLLTCGMSALFARPAVQSAGKAEAAKLDEYLHIPDSLLQTRTPYDLVWRPGLGYIRETEIPDDWAFDVDSFLYRYATLPLPELYQEVNYYYDDYIMHLGKEGKQRELERMKKAARQYKSSRLEDETRFLDAFVIYGSEWVEPISRGREAAGQLEKEGKHILALRLKYDLLRKANAGFDDLYHHAFRIAGELTGDLEQVTEDEFIYKRAAYGEIGHLHYTFRNYEVALPLLEKALSEGNRYFFDRSNLRARNTLAVYYHSIDSLEKSACYYHSILESPDFVFSRGMFDAIAWANLGHIAAETGRYRQALSLYEAALPVSLQVNDYNFAAGIMTGMGNCLIETGEPEKARQVIDTTLVWIRDPAKHVSTHRYRKLYPLIGKYYLRQGDIATFERYADSTAIAEKKYEEVFNARVILRAQHEIFEAEKAVHDEKIRASRNYTIGLAVILVLVAAIAVMMTLHSRRLRRKNRSLFDRLKDQYMLERENNRLRGLLQERPAGMENGNNGKEKNGDDLFFRLSALMEDPTVYADTTLTRKSLADRLYTNESYLRETIMERTGLTFTEYLAGIRLNHARRLLLDTTHKYTVQEIVHECGFGGTSTFYRIFKNYYGMTPDQFRNSADEK